VSTKLIVIILLIFGCVSTACVTADQKEGLAARQPSVSPSLTPTPPPLVSFLREGGLWTVQTDGGGERQVAAPPPGLSINDHVWSGDGRLIYYAIGNKYYSCALAETPGRTQKIEEVGELALPEGAIIDSLELAREGNVLIAHAIPQNGELNQLPKIYATGLGKREARELSVDEYATLAPLPPVIVRGFQDLSVSPDGRWILFKENVGDCEQLFIADVDTGARFQISDLAALDGFEPSADPSGARHILEATWSPNGRFVVFNPAQSCSDLGLCYGQLFLLDVWTGVQYQLTREMTVNIPLEWNSTGSLLAYDDGGQIVIADTEGQIRRLAEGSRPKFQPQG
jgi:Tol biopolymer transport system component